MSETRCRHRGTARISLALPMLLLLFPTSAAFLFAPTSVFGKNRICPSRGHQLQPLSSREKRITLFSRANPPPNSHDYGNYNEPDYSMNLENNIGNLFSISRGESSFIDEEKFAMKDNDMFTESNGNPYNNFLEPEVNMNGVEINEPEVPSSSTEEFGASSNNVSYSVDPSITKNGDIASLLSSMMKDNPFDSEVDEAFAAPMLDAETYSNMAVGKDGSIRGKTVPPPMTSNFVRSAVDNNIMAPSLAEMNFGGENGDGTFLDPEELHRMVFEQETGFLKQSSKFKDSLGGKNQTKVEDATAQRRGEKYRAQQVNVAGMLEREMENFGEILKNRADNPKQKEMERDLEELLGASKRHKRLVTNRNGPENGARRFGKSNNPTSKESASTAYRDNRNENRLQGGSRGASQRSRTRNSPENMDKSVDARQINELAQMEFFRREMLRYKNSAEIAETEVRRLRAVVKGLENTLSAALGKNSLDDDGDGNNEQQKEAKIEDGNDLGSPWIPMEDPETNNIFYLNEETGETKWDR